MSTSGRLSIITAEGKLNSISCFNNGHPSHLGEILLSHYNTYETVSNLINLGNLNSIGENIVPLGNTSHSWCEPAPNTTVAYHRDSKLKEPLIIYTFSSLKCYNKYRVYMFEDYKYMYFNNEWHIEYLDEWIKLDRDIINNTSEVLLNIC